jgi:hypothetical protein
MFYINDGVSSLASYLSYSLLIIHYILSSKTKLNLWMIAIGMLFFSISSLSGDKYIPAEIRDYIMIIIKYFILVICGYELLKHTSTREISIFLIIGATTILAQIIFFNNPLIDYGRYSGFYLNPNVGGFICLIGYGLSFANENKNIRLFLQVVFTLMGLLTFSRTFILLWILTNLIAIKINVKNAKVLLYGFGLLLAFVIYSEFLPVKNPRLAQLSALVKGEKVNTTEISEDSRTETWSLYYEALLNQPILGNGYNSFQGNSHISTVGVHNSFLKMWGEAGIILFIVFSTMYLVMLKQTYQIFDSDPHLFMITIAVILFLTTNHNFFETEFILLVSMWIQAKISWAANNNQPPQANMNH